jgi:acyl-CoA synthetase (AMP-forming)/AMP-acid ligase II
MPAWSTLRRRLAAASASLVVQAPSVISSLATFLAQSSRRADRPTNRRAARILTRQLPIPCCTKASTFGGMRADAPARRAAEWLLLGWPIAASDRQLFSAQRGRALTGAPRDDPRPGAARRFFRGPASTRLRLSVSTARRTARGCRPRDRRRGHRGRVPGDLTRRGPTIFAGYWRAPESTARAYPTPTATTDPATVRDRRPRGEYYRYRRTLSRTGRARGMKGARRGSRGA